MIVHRKADGCKQADRNSGAAPREMVDSHHFADVVSIDGTRDDRIGDGDKKPQSLLVTSGVSSKITPATARIRSLE